MPCLYAGQNPLTPFPIAQPNLFNLRAYFNKPKEKHKKKHPAHSRLNPTHLRLPLLHFSRVRIP